MFVSFMGATGAITSASTDVVSVVRTAAGVYDITVNQPYPAGSSAFVGSNTGLTSDLRAISIVDTSDTVKTVTWTTVAGAALDSDTSVIGVK